VRITAVRSHPCRLCSVRMVSGVRAPHSVGVQARRCQGAGSGLPAVVISHPTPMFPCTGLCSMPVDSHAHFRVTSHVTGNAGARRSGSGWCGLVRECEWPSAACVVHVLLLRRIGGSRGGRQMAALARAMWYGTGWNRPSYRTRGTGQGSPASSSCPVGRLLCSSTSSLARSLGHCHASRLPLVPHASILDTDCCSRDARAGCLVCRGVSRLDAGIRGMPTLSVVSRDPVVNTPSLGQDARWIDGSEEMCKMRDIEPRQSLVVGVASPCRRAGE
jgi:hypothetical protein